MKTLLPNKDFFIEENHFYLIADGNPGKMVTHSTEKLHGVKQLDRSLFVKPTSALADFLDMTDEVLSLPSSITINGDDITIKW